MSERSKLVSMWIDSFTKGADYDSWGQVVEAVDEYQMLSRQLLKETAADSCIFTDSQKKTLAKISSCLELRSRSLTSSHDVADELSYEDLKKVGQTLLNILSANQKEFPVHVPDSATRPPPTKKGFEFEIDGDENDDDDDPDLEDDEDDDKVLINLKVKAKSPGMEGSLKGSLLPRISPESGTTRLTIRIEKIGLKDALIYSDPFIVISAKDQTGIDVTNFQSTPTSIKKEDPYIIFEVDVEIQKALEKLPKGTAIFFEFKHYKPKKRLTSIKCFAFLEMDEIKPGPMVVELYKKPTDYKRKKLSLLTNKPLYLSLFLTLHKE